MVKVGDTRPEPVDIRVVAATNKVLEEEIARGAFREDLYYRLNVVSIHLPPLRERGDDVAVIARYFLQRYAREYASRARSLAPAALVAMMPNDSEAHNLLGITLASQQRFDTAGEQFKRALQLNPAHEEARANLARVTALQARGR